MVHIHRAFIHPTAEVERSAKIGPNTTLWGRVHIRAKAIIGKNCIIGENVYIDSHVKIGNNVKIQNGSYIYKGVDIEDDVFIGPKTILTNDKYPRAVTINGKLKKRRDWHVGTIVIKKGASLGAGVIILPDVAVGGYALIGAGALITKNVPPQALVMGVPGKITGFVCVCGAPLKKVTSKHQKVKIICARCGTENTICY